VTRRASATSKLLVHRALANSDIAEAIDHYLIEGGEDVALGFVDALEAAFKHVGRWPATGSPRYGHALDLPGLRFWPCTRHPYLVFYVEKDEQIEVWRVLHAGRDIPRWLDEHSTTDPK
jgi:toxin ParE1/3/4